MLVCLLVASRAADPRRRRSPASLRSAPTRAGRRLVGLPWIAPNPVKGGAQGNSGSFAWVCRVGFGLEKARLGRRTSRSATHGASGTRLARRVGRKCHRKPFKTLVSRPEMAPCADARPATGGIPVLGALALQSRRPRETRSARNSQAPAALVLRSPRSGRLEGRLWPASILRGPLPPAKGASG